MARNKLSLPEQKARETISNNLKHFSRGITQKKLSERTGIPTSTISGYFAKRSTPNAGALQKLADALNVNKSDIDPRYKTDSPTPTTSTPQTADLADEDVIFTYEGKKIPPEDLEYMKRILRGGKA